MSCTGIHLISIMTRVYVLLARGMLVSRQLVSDTQKHVSPIPLPSVTSMPAAEFVPVSAIFCSVFTWELSSLEA
jgi:hypothetical protein